MNKEEITKQLNGITLLFDEPLMNVTFTKTGGPADILALPKTQDEVQRLIKYCRTQNLSWTVLGNASNLIVRDGGIRGMVIILTEMNEIHINNDKLIVDAGAKLIDSTYAALEHQLTGFEFACGIPGSIGGAVYMNAGAYDGEIQNIFESARFMMADGSIKNISKEEMNFSYRHSRMQEIHGIILQATFALRKGNHQKIEQRMEELTELRQLKQPLEYPSCGSVFKRPTGYFTGKLIQEAGLQGLKWGGAQISEKHAGFIVNINNATATDYLELIEHIQSVIQKKFDVSLQTEVQIIGEKTKD